MIDIDILKPKIIDALMPLKPDKIILFGSYAYGTPNEDSDIDLFLLKDDLSIDDTRLYQREARKRLLDIRKRYDTNGIDVLSVPTEYIKKNIFIK
ncbi:MAG: nucleotidyltransferase domain-containing protein [Campylobacterota bacterium]|nr:nucleotidyltransferase domain-containing protein [Campylobacterota bacterium]